MSPSFSVNHRSLKAAVRAHFPWARWQTQIDRSGITIDRPRATAHPEYPSIIYPLDYGFIPGTVGSDREPIDVFVGSGEGGLVGALLTTDYRQEKRELKFLYDCTPVDIYTAHGFVNYDRSLLKGVLVLRRQMARLWSDVSS